ncbi:hypothetical protein EVJ58_g3989 [Rhodofomes roseus]|uniref:CxC1-like cysteine cluster associated with KDZ transposases domain-containing protein n=1 Tax=Rhodofomes roseus TaxID=34475 RepID=A0A4Y9YI67_9APHY|nr:hypothetical protein EVJ58_g3989 [Rhodofomes roseus]
MASVRSYLSSSVAVTSGNPFGPRKRSRNVKLSSSKKRREENAAEQRLFVAGLSFEDRDAYNALNAEPSVQPQEDNQDNDYEDMYSLPPGEEAFFLSHAGGEMELCQDLVATRRKRDDFRIRHDRLLRARAEWQAQLPTLVDAYLAWKVSISGSSDVPAAGADYNQQQPDADVQQLESQGQGPQESGGEGQTEGLGPVWEWEVTTVEFFVLSKQTFKHVPPARYANATLVSNGFLGSSPQKPTVAISLKVLDAYRQLHRACPRLSVQAYVKSLCYIHRVPLKKHLVKQFSDAYDIYLDIQYHIDKLVDSALGRDTPDWRMHNACAPCLYKLEHEPTLKYSLLATMDGNQSLKLVDDAFRNGRVRADGQEARTDIWLLPSEVDRFKDEAGKANNKASAIATDVTASMEVAAIANDTDRAPDVANAEVRYDHDDDIAWLGLSDREDDGNLEASVDVCVERWRNAGPEARKKMFALFAKTGIFVCLCRHGQLLILCDMIRSGELMKYPLAIINKLMEVYGPDILVGYDIACAFAKTLARSSLGPEARRLRMAGVVPAFHGHGHNRGCQVNWHPLYMNGVGKEDFEGCERCFSESNALAAGTRLSSAFHRQQAIEEFFRFWGEDKHHDSGTFIYNNYRQALNIIADDSRALAALSTELRVSTTDLEEYLKQEREYIHNRKNESPEVARKLDYLAALRRLEEASSKLTAATVELRKVEGNIAQYATKEVARVRGNRTRAANRYFATDDDCRAYEQELQIAVRWLPASDEYQEACQLLTLREYQRSLDELERLVVQRLFELTKAGMSGTGYKLREKISKALKARAEAIRKALKRYNDKAAKLNPPRPQLTWSEVVDMVNLADFDLLRETRDDIRKQPWAQYPNRRATNLHFNIKRAREEIERLNVEIRRLLTSMYDEHVDYHLAVQQASVSAPYLAHELRERWQYRNSIHARIAARLHQTSQLPRFSGTLTTGLRIGRPATQNDGIPLPFWAHGFVGMETEEDGGFDGEADDTEPLFEGINSERDANVYVDFIDNLGRREPS